MIEPDLSGRTALVTGSAKGVGRHVLLGLAEFGARVAVHYYSSDEAARVTAGEARSLGSPDVETVQGDVTDPDDVDRLFERVEERLGSVDILVNNVGDFAPVHWEELDLDTWNRVLTTNLTGTFLSTKRALPSMREAGFGRIVNVGYASSERGLVNPTNFPFFVAKAGILMFTRMVAADTQGDGITVNAVSPYVVENSDAFPPELPRDRPASFEDVVNVVSFFVDEDSDYVSGANVEVDGGWLPETV
jgi:NAD(P)-dependent dehydrogenase (short-subunit alcohol dehydrogenase family)